VPSYRNRPYIDPDIEVRRYLDLDGLLDVVSNKRLRLTRVNRFNDPFEGSVSKKTQDDYPALFVSSYSNIRPASTMEEAIANDPWNVIKSLRKAMTASSHACCWTHGPESEAMWRLYCADGGRRGYGVAIQTTYRKLEASIAHHDLFFSPIRYLDYEICDKFKDEIDPIMSKRIAFEHEREVRLFHFDRAHNSEWAATVRNPSAQKPVPLAEYIYRDWSPVTVIDKVSISPYADECYEKNVKDRIALADPSLAGRVELSEFSERKNPPRY
jgi:hypothetical protein